MAAAARYSSLKDASSECNKNESSWNSFEPARVLESDRISRLRGRSRAVSILSGDAPEAR